MTSPRRRKNSDTAPRVLVGSAVGIVGLGQIGGSILRRLSDYRSDIALFGTDRNARLATRIRRFGRWRKTLSELVTGCDVLILAVPAPEIMRALPQIADIVRGHERAKRLMVLDIGSVKYPILEAARHFGQWYDFVGMHPMAGTENNGWPGSDSRLFENRRIVICPSSAVKASRAAREIVRLLGGIPLRLEAKEHDRLMAEAIGLPHVLAYAAARMSRSVGRKNPLKSDSWHSLTRVAGSNPEMVAGFLKSNPKETAKAIREFVRQLGTIASSIESRTQTTSDVARILKGRG